MSNSGREQATRLTLRGANQVISLTSGGLVVTAGDSSPALALEVTDRPDGKSQDRLDPERYNINTLYQVQSISVIEFAKCEMIHYDYFKDPKNLDDWILFDAAPQFTGDNQNQPGLKKPIFKFTIDGKGGWRLQIERDGTDGLAGGDKEGDFDLEFTHESPGAKPYTVNLTTDNSAWALSTFSPGGKPADTSEILLGIKPIDRATGAPVACPDRRTRVRDIKVDQLPAKLRDAAKADAVAN